MSEWLCCWIGLCTCVNACVCMKRQKARDTSRWNCCSWLRHKNKTHTHTQNIYTCVVYDSWYITTANVLFVSHLWCIILVVDKIRISDIFARRHSLWPFISTLPGPVYTSWGTEEMSGVDVIVWTAKFVVFSIAPVQHVPHIQYTCSHAQPYTESKLIAAYYNWFQISHFFSAKCIMLQ